MRADVIATLAWYKPRSNAAAGLYHCNDIPGLSAKQAGDIMHYAECFADMAFGWHFADAVRNGDKPFPSTLRGPDQCVWRAYRFLQGDPDPLMEQVVALQTPGNKGIATQIKALLLTGTYGFNQIAEKMGIHPEVVVAYEKLCFNIVDRNEDHAFIANLVYPEGRLVEGKEDYLAQATLEELMLRAGYTHGVDHILYLSGLSNSHPYRSFDTSMGAAELDQMFIMDGCLFASSGWMHTKSHDRPISNARLSIQASKMGNNDTGDSGQIVTLADTFRGEIEEMGRRKVGARIKVLQDARATGTIIEDTKALQGQP